MPPLSGVSDPPPIFDQQWTNEPNQQFVGPLEKGIPTLITWNRGGNTILVEGSWDNWTSRYICSGNMLMIHSVFLFPPLLVGTLPSRMQAENVF